MSADYSAMKLGKQPPKDDPRTLRLARYLNLSVLPTPPTSTGRSSAFATGFPMFLNDRLGNCTCAGVAHLQQFWGDLSGAVEQISDDNVLALYEAVGGYNPADPSTDQGAVEVNVLNYWRQTGITTVAGPKKIDAYASVNITDEQLVRTAMWLFEGLYIGIALPVTAQGQDVWDVVSTSGDGAPGSWGGHAVVAVDYDNDGVTVITWGQLKRATWAFWAAYVDEAYACLAADQRNSAGMTAEGFDTAALTADLQAVTC